FKLDRKIFTRSHRAQGEIDPLFELLQQHNFSVSPNSIVSNRARSSSRVRRNRIPVEGEASVTCRALLLSDTQIP
ncbi:hypothetical protein KI387_011282, partial [Taxus chinensis]